VKLPSFIAADVALVERELDRIVPPEATRPVDLHRAMRYTLLAPSKRVRAVLVLQAARVCGSDERALPAAAAVELIHASSLILDDLPALDNAPLRRGRPSNHVAHGEAMALMAAFALFNLAFGTIARAYDAPTAQRLTGLMSDAVGSDGLIGGEVEDVLAADRAVSFDTLELIHRCKTGALFVGAATAGAVTAGAEPDQVSALAAYAKNLGLAFQIVDDLLDVEQSSEALGKTAGKDAAQQKITFPAVYGLEASHRMAEDERAGAHAALEIFGSRADRLRDLADLIVRRKA